MLCSAPTRRRGLAQAPWKASRWPGTRPEPTLLPQPRASPLLVFLQEKILNHLSTLRRDRDTIQGFQAKGEADILAALVSEAVEGERALRQEIGRAEQELLSL